MAGDGGLEVSVAAVVRAVMKFLFRCTASNSANRYASLALRTRGREAVSADWQRDKQAS